MIQQYKDKIERFKKEIKNKDSKATWIGFIKLGLVISIGFTIYKTIKDIEYIYLLAILCICYILFAILQSHLKSKITMMQNSITIYKRHIDRMNGQWISFSDIGEEYLKEEHPYAKDLDIIGEKSVFQYLNITNTYHGRKQFIKDLLFPNYSIHEIKERQVAIQELSKTIDFINEIELKTINIGTEDRILKIIKIITKTNKIKISSFLQKLLYIIPIIATISFISGLYFKLLIPVIIGMSLLILQIGIWILFIAKLQEIFQLIRTIPFHLKEYTNVFSYISKQEFSATILQRIKETLDGNSLSSSQAMKDLNTIISMISVGNNILIYGILNIFCLWDFHCYIRFKKWQDTYGDACESWFISLGELESLMSFAILPMCCTHTCMPEIQETTKGIEALQLGHPLLDNNQRVNNDFSLKQEIVIISGSNMSGKTTFMRTIGMNLLLSRIGSFVCAKQMQTSIFELVSSMRITDNLNDGVSTFYAELKNIKNILEVAKTNKNTFFMIDEIFRGTNSIDRLEGAQLVLKQLQQLEVSGIITTHDIELCKMEEKYINIYNYHFSERYEDNQILFDYQLQKGISTTTNAKRLMRMLGIIE